MVARPSICGCGGAVFYADTIRGAVCRSCGRDSITREPTLAERGRGGRPKGSHKLLVTDIGDWWPTASDCPDCLKNVSGVHECQTVLQED